MKLAQIRDSLGVITAAIAENGGFRPIPGQTLASLIEKAESENRELTDIASELGSSETVSSEAATRETWRGSVTWSAVMIANGTMTLGSACIQTCRTVSTCCIRIGHLDAELNSSLGPVTSRI